MLDRVVSGLLGLLGNIRDDRINTQNKKDLAVSLILTAVNETKIYLRRNQRTNKRSRKREEKLSRLWSAAAIPLNRFNRDLAERCLQKSEYWLNPENYTSADIKKFRIGLDQVYKEARKMF